MGESGGCGSGSGCDEPRGRRHYCRRKEACAAGRRGSCLVCQPRRSRTPAQLARDRTVLEAWRGGQSLRRIAAMHDITHQRVLQILRSAEKRGAGEEI